MALLANYLYFIACRFPVGYFSTVDSQIYRRINWYFYLFLQKTVIISGFNDGLNKALDFMLNDIAKLVTLGLFSTILGVYLYFEISCQIYR